MSEEEATPEQLARARRWDAAASVLGYNELVKTAEGLGEKVYFRIARDSAEEHFVKLGGEKFVKHAKSILDLRDSMPRVAFSEKDIELMRRAVADYDKALA